MRYSILGTTGMKASVLGFGCMRLPEKNGKVDRELSTPMLRKAYESGINFFDTAIGYCNGDSQAALGEAVQPFRDKVLLSTKNHHSTAPASEWRKHLENSLKFLRTDYLDIYNHHGINWDLFTKNLDPSKEGLTKEMFKAKEEGLIRHIGFSFHDKPESLIKLADTGYYETVILQYNLLDQANADAIQYAAEKGMGIIIMGPVGGGRLGINNESINELTGGAAKTTPEAALRFVLGNTFVNVALSGMQTMDMLIDNLRIVENSVPFTREQILALNRLIDERKKKSGLYCTACRYCTPECEQNVPIPELLDLLNQVYIYNLKSNAKQRYNWLGVKATDCINCGTCARKCPQKIDIPTRMREAAFMFDEKAGTMDVDTAIEDLKADGSLKIRLHLHNLTNERSGADITLAPLQNITIKTPSIKIEEIPPFSRRKREVDASYTPECRRIDYKIDVDYGKKVQIDKSYQFLSLRKGLSDGWDAKGWIEVNAKPEHFTKDAATAELHGLKFKLSYDETGLLLLLDVRDDFLAPSDPAKHKGALVDSVELFLDGRKEASIGRRPYDTGVYQIGLYPGNPGTTPPFFHVSQNRQFSIDLTSERTTQGYRLRARIPFADFSLQSSTPKKIGFDLAVNTADSAGNRIGQYVYAGTPDNWRNASGFRQVWLW